jgi:hypothetical protein
MGPDEMAAFNKAVYDALKPGGSTSCWTTPLSAARRPMSPKPYTASGRRRSAATRARSLKRDGYKVAWGARCTRVCDRDQVVPKINIEALVDKSFGAKHPVGATQGVGDDR